jgi:hypothetical protein
LDDQRGPDLFSAKRFGTGLWHFKSYSQGFEVIADNAALVRLPFRRDPLNETDHEDQLSKNVIIGRTASSSSPHD